MSTKKIKITIAVLGVFLALGIATPAFAWHLQGCTGVKGEGTCSFTTQISSASPVLIGTKLTDTAMFTGCDSNNHCGKVAGGMTGTVTWKVYADGTCSGTPIKGWVGSSSTSDTKSLSGKTNPVSITSDQFSTSGLSTSKTYSFQATYSGSGSWSSASAKGPCEPFTLYKSISTPEFPMGAALLMALTIPGLLLVRRKFVRPTV